MNNAVNEKLDDEGCRTLDDVPSSSPYGEYGSAEHQMYGDGWLYQDCPGAW